MKFHCKGQLSIFLILLIVLKYSCSFPTFIDYKWVTKSISYKDYSIKVITLSHLDERNLDKVLELIDKSAESEDIEKVSYYPGLIRGNDVICVNEKLLFWFSATPKKKRSVRSGGGILSGIWEIKLIDNLIDLKGKNDSNYYPNLLLPGSKPGIKLFGADIYGGYADKKSVWGLENAINLREGSKMGKRIIDSDRGPYSADGGVFIEFKGLVANSGLKEEGFETDYDTDPRPGKIGKTSYELVYRIPAKRDEIIQEIKFKVEENNFGPISTAYMAMYLPGHAGKKMSWASNPELMPKSIGLNLQKVSVNNYFRNTAVKKVYFYDLEYEKHPDSKHAAQTPDGRGRIACIGSPENYVHYMCGYPTNDYIPKEAYSEYTLEVSDNQTLRKYGKFHSLNYKLINSQNKSITIEKDNSFIMIMRYKLIDASNAAAAVENREKLKSV